MRMPGLRRTDHRPRAVAALASAVLLACSNGDGDGEASGPPPAKGNTGSDEPAAGEPEEPGETFTECPEDLDALVGTQLTLIGVQTKSKIPTVCGVDVDGADELSDERVEVSGRLERYEIEPPEPDEPVRASRGPGVYYKLVDPATGELARTRELF